MAKDFGLPTKTIMEILTKYGSAPKNHMQVLTDRELSIIFDRLTQDHPISDIQIIFTETYQESKPAPAAEKFQKTAQPTPAKPAGQQNSPQQAAPGKSAAQPKAGQKPAQKPQNAQGSGRPAAQPNPTQQPSAGGASQPVQKPASQIGRAHV